MRYGLTVGKGIHFRVTTYLSRAMAAVGAWPVIGKRNGTDVKGT